ncbi:hypothetical protein ZOSMA_27G00860 [Zostera marina]|uniref:Uncharacterized protein n=1 Tax=Zostera marina TaxID=29655 RepID=A0A0K9PFL8_ZOSMR|nr:hypothetical protein ZOSMA_27G00860 [Zostera marina]
MTSDRLPQGQGASQSMGILKSHG